MNDRKFCINCTHYLQWEGSAVCLSPKAATTSLITRTANPEREREIPIGCGPDGRLFEPSPEYVSPLTAPVKSKPFSW